MAVRITAKRDGFRRCGIPHPAEPVDYPDDRFTDEELGTLLAERMLIVEVREGEPVLTNGEPLSTDGKLLSTGGEQSAAAQSLQRVAAIKGVLPRLSKDASALTANNGPKLDALEAALGFRPTAAERDRAWAEFQEAGE